MKIMNRSGEPLAGHQLLASLEAEGVAFLSEADGAEAFDIFRETLRVYQHPDSAGAPWTAIQPVPGHRYSPGSGGFTRGALSPHTDRSRLDVPPSILCFLMVTAASGGGDSILLDTKPLLSRYRRDVLARIGRDLQLSSSLQGWCQNVLSISDNGSVIVRYRDDEVARPRADSPVSAALLHDLRHPAAGALRFHLGPGEGYVVHNHRILHGRTSFSGLRRGVRMLFHVKESSPHAHLNDGFFIDHPHGESECTG